MTIASASDEAEVWTAHVDLDERVVVHVSPSWRRMDELRWSHEVAVAAESVTPEAVAPVRVGDRSVTRWGPRLVAMSPFVQGDALDHDDPAQVAAAARLLARIHGDLLEPRLGSPPSTSALLNDDPLLRDDELDRH